MRSPGPSRAIRNRLILATDWGQWEAAMGRPKPGSKGTAPFGEWEREGSNPKRDSNLIPPCGFLTDSESENGVEVFIPEG